jgi:hypothetical protein
MATDRLPLRLEKLAQVINSMTMVGVFMRPDNRVDARRPSGQQLLSQIGRRVD